MTEAFLERARGQMEKWLRERALDVPTEKTVSVRIALTYVVELIDGKVFGPTHRRRALAAMDHAMIEVRKP